MGYGFKHGGSSPKEEKGMELNFRVLGGTTAPTALDNDIWINTDIVISGWAFSASEPTPSEGMVWITTGLASNAPFNALPENQIVVYPISAKQYVSGEWVSKGALSYQNGKWVDWVSGVLFDNGTDNTEMTGGWKSYAFSAGSGYTAVTEDISVSTVGLTVVLDTSTSNNHSTFVGPVNKFNLSEYNLLKMTFSEAVASVSGGGAVEARVYSDEGLSAVASAPVLSTDGNFTSEVEIDVSELSGEHYIGFFMWKWSDKNRTVRATMTSAKLS